MQHISFKILVEYEILKMLGLDRSCFLFYRFPSGFVCQYLIKKFCGETPHRIILGSTKIMQHSDKYIHWLSKTSKDNKFLEIIFS